MSQIGLWKADGSPDPVSYGKRLLDVAVRRYKPVALFGLMSGGHDSLCATHMVSEHPAFSGVVHINTGIGIEQTREFVRRTCRDRDWRLLEYRAEDEGQFYDDLVLEYGFPGPFHHRKMYNRLKERAMRALVRDHKQDAHDRVMVVTGVRKAESTRRMGTVQPINREGSRIWVAPIAWFTDRDKAAYMDRHDLPRNEVVDQLHMSGECLCGAFAKPGELEWLEFCGYRDVVQRIRDLETQAARKGLPCKWGKTPTKHDPAQLAPGPLCVGCGGAVE